MMPVYEQKDPTILGMSPEAAPPPPVPAQPVLSAPAETAPAEPAPAETPVFTSAQFAPAADAPAGPFYPAYAAYPTSAAYPASAPSYPPYPYSYDPYPYEYPPYAFGPAPETWRAEAPPVVHTTQGGTSKEPKTKRGKTKPKARLFPIVALCLLFTLVGGAVGGTLGVSLLPRLQPSPPADTTAAPLVAAADTGGTGGDSALLPIVTQSGASLTTRQIYENCNPSVVAIATETTVRNVFGQTVTQPAAGSGFIVSADGRIVTNNHVIESASSVSVTLHNGKSYKATVVGRDSETDLAALKIDATGLTPLVWGDSKTLKVGDPAIAIGNPLGELANTMTSGIISALDRAINIDGTPRNMLQTDASISPGNSGGPLINQYGQVVGIITAKSTGSGVEGLGFAIPAVDAQPILDDLFKNGRVTGRPQFGITVQRIEGSLAQSYRVEAGLYIISVEAGSCADKAGLRAGDQILELGGVAVSTPDELNAQKNKYKAGATVTIKISRDGGTLTREVVFDEKTELPNITTETQPRIPGGFFWPEDSDGL
jgi:serine protease Do